MNVHKTVWIYAGPRGRLTFLRRALYSECLIHQVWKEIFRRPVRGGDCISGNPSVVFPPHGPLPRRTVKEVGRDEQVGDKFGLSYGFLQDHDVIALVNQR